MLKIELNHPVEPAAVEMIKPLDDCSSVLPLNVILYLAEICDVGPINKSLNASKLWPSLRLAWANRTFLTL